MKRLQAVVAAPSMQLLREAVIVCAPRGVHSVCVCVRESERESQLHACGERDQHMAREEENV